MYIAINLKSTNAFVVVKHQIFIYFLKASNIYSKLNMVI